MNNFFLLDIQHLLSHAHKRISLYSTHSSKYSIVCLFTDQYALVQAKAEGNSARLKAILNRSMNKQPIRSNATVQTMARYSILRYSFSDRGFQQYTTVFCAVVSYALLDKGSGSGSDIDTALQRWKPTTEISSQTRSHKKDTQLFSCRA